MRIAGAKRTSAMGYGSKTTETTLPTPASFGPAEKAIASARTPSSEVDGRATSPTNAA